MNLHEGVAGKPECITTQAAGVHESIYKIVEHTADAEQRTSANKLTRATGSYAYGEGHIVMFY